MYEHVAAYIAVKERIYLVILYIVVVEIFFPFYSVQQ